jgi:hypothetical protein
MPFVLDGAAAALLTTARRARDDPRMGVFQFVEMRLEHGTTLLPSLVKQSLATSKQRKRNCFFI